jgi:hypothetical protein
MESGFIICTFSNMILRISLLFLGSKGEKKLYALFDTGSTYSCIREDLATEIGNLESLPKTMYFTTASENQYLKVENRMGLNFEVNEITLTDEFMVVPGLSEEVIIGATTMQKWRIKLDFEHDTLIVDPKVAVIILKSLQQEECLAF